MQHVREYGCTFAGIRRVCQEDARSGRAGGEPCFRPAAKRNGIHLLRPHPVLFRRLQTVVQEEIK